MQSGASVPLFASPEPIAASASLKPPLLLLHSALLPSPLNQRLSIARSCMSFPRGQEPGVIRRMDKYDAAGMAKMLLDFR
jgi:hypothetical protein